MTLDEKVQEIDSIKTDIITCHNSLKTILPTKGVTVLPTDKMSILIGKVNDIEIVPTFSEGTTKLIYKVKSNTTTSSNWTFDLGEYIAFFNGSFSMSVMARAKNGYTSIRHYNNSGLFTTYTIDVSGDGKTISSFYKGINNVKKGDRFTIQHTFVSGDTYLDSLAIYTK